MPTESKYWKYSGNACKVQQKHLTKKAFMVDLQFYNLYIH